MKLELFSIGPITIHGYGFMIALGVLACMTLALHRTKKYNKKEEATLDIIIYSLIAGFLGAKILYVIVEFEDFLKDPMSVLGSEGFVVYGGIILGVIAAVLYCRWKKLSFLEYFDILMPCVSVAQGFGRIGCFLAGCCYGRETTSFLGVVFPEGCMAPAGVKLLPTQLFSSLGDFIIAGTLIWFHSKKSKHTGDVGALYMLLYGVGRFGIEMLRSDSRGSVGTLSTSQAISIFIVLGSLVLFTLNKKRADKEIKDDILG